MTDWTVVFSHVHCRCRIRASRCLTVFCWMGRSFVCWLHHCHPQLFSLVFFISQSSSIFWFSSLSFVQLSSVANVLYFSVSVSVMSAVLVNLVQGPYFFIVFFSRCLGHLSPYLPYPHNAAMYEGRPINKLQNGIILLVFKSEKIRTIRFVRNLV